MEIATVFANLFRRRPLAPAGVYVPALLISLWFGLWSTEDGGLLGAIPYGILLLVCVLQMKYRTVAGWGFLLLLFSAYTCVVLINPSNGTPGEYAVFAASGLIPTCALAIGHPFNRVPREPMADT